MRNPVSRRTRFALGAVALMLASLPAYAQFPDDIPDNFRLALGGIFASFNNSVAASFPNAPGGSIDFTGDKLTPDTKNTFRGEGSWNFLGRSYFDFGYLDFKLDGSRQITKDFVFNGLVYTAGAEVSGETRSRYIYGAYRYGIIKNPSVHWGISLGISYTSLTAQLSATAGVRRPDGSVVQGGATSKREVNVPIPLIGTELEFRILPRLTLFGRARAIGATVDPYSGSWIEYAGGLNWYFAQNFGAGVAYEYQKLHFKKNESQPNAFRFDSRYDGPRVTIAISF